jgi:hypothetical protein
MSDKKAIAANIREFGSTPLYREFIKLFLVHIEELRLSNDSADRETVLKNQGGILKLKAIIKSIDVNVIPKRTKDYDGGFND